MTAHIRVTFSDELRRIHPGLPADAGLITPEQGPRLVLDLGDLDRVDAALVAPDDAPTTVRDVLSGERYEVRRSDCGLGCRCAVVATAVA